MYGADHKQAMEQFSHHAINYTSLALLLIDKGITTEEELDRFRARATHMVDQIMAEAEKEVKEKFEKEYPALSKLFKDRNS